MTLEHQLKEFGFSDKQAKLYLVGLSNPQSSIQELTKKSGLKRSTVAFLLNELIEKGLVINEKKGRRNIYSSITPDKLFSLQKQKIKLLGQLLPELMAQTKITKTSPVVRMYETIEGIKSVFEEMLIDKPREFRAIFNSEVAAIVANRYFVDKFRQRRFEAGIKSKFITLNTKEGQKLARTQNKFNSETKLLSGSYEFETELLIWNNKSCLIHYLENERIMLVIESHSISQFMNMVFNFFWNNI